MIKFVFTVVIAIVTCFVIVCFAGSLCACILSSKISREIEKQQLKEKLLERKGGLSN